MSAIRTKSPMMIYASPSQSFPDFFSAVFGLFVMGTSIEGM